MADFTEAIELNSTNARAYSNRGLAKFEMGDFDGALTDYDRAEQLSSRRVIRQQNECVDPNIYSSGVQQ